jgi:hypothetical protein
MGDLAVNNINNVLKFKQNYEYSTMFAIKFCTEIQHQKFCNILSICNLKNELTMHEMDGFVIIIMFAFNFFKYDINA